MNAITIMELPLRKTILIYCGIILCLLNIAVPCSGSKIIRRSTKPIIENVQSAKGVVQQIQHSNKNDDVHNVRKRLILDNDADDVDQDNFPDHDYEVYQGVVGRPGIDFPVLKRIPSTAFNCRKYGSGYFADIETDCQVFHICEGGKKISFLCPNGTIFQQSDKICDWWFKVNCAASPSYYEDSAEFLAHNPQHRTTYAQRLQNGFKVDSSSKQYDSADDSQRYRNEQQQKERERQRQHNNNNNNNNGQYDIEQRHTKNANRNDGKLRESSRHQTVSNRQNQQQQKLTTNFEKPINILDVNDDDDVSDELGPAKINSNSNENYDFEDISSSSLPVKSSGKQTTTKTTSIRTQQNGIKNNAKETNFINNHRNIKDISKSVGIASGGGGDDETLENAASGSFINNRNDLTKQFNEEFRKNIGLTKGIGNDYYSASGANSKSNGKYDDGGYSFATPSTPTASSASSPSSSSSLSSSTISSSAKNRNNQRNNRISYFGPDTTGHEESTITDKPTKNNNNVLSGQQQSQTNVARPTTTSNKNARRGTATYRNTQLLNSQNGADAFQSQRIRQQNNRNTEQNRNDEQNHNNEQNRNKEQIRKDQYDNQLFVSSSSSAYTTPNSIGSDKKHRRTQEIQSTTTPFYTPTIPAIIKNRYDTQFNNNNNNNNNNDRISFKKRPTATTESTLTYDATKSSEALSEHAFEMMKTLRKLNLDASVETKDIERLIKDQRIGLNIPASSGPDTLHSLALYFATAIDNDLTTDEDLTKPKATASTTTTTTTTSTASTATLTTTNHTPIEILELGQNITEISSNGHLSNDTLRKYEKLFGLDQHRSTTTESLANIFQREQAAFNEKQLLLGGKQNSGRPQNVQSRFLNENIDGSSQQSSEDLNVAHSTNPMSADGLGTTQVRQLASVFTHALSAYLHDPAKFREALSEIRPTEPTPIQSKKSIAKVNAVADEMKTLTTVNFLTNRLGRTEDFHKGTGPTYLPTKSTPTYRQLSTTASGITTENLEVLDFSDVSQSTMATIKSSDPQLTTTISSSSKITGQNTRKSIFDEVTTISTASKLKTQNIKSADRVPASRFLTETRFGSTGGDAAAANQYTTTQKNSGEDSDDGESTTTTNPLAYEINSGLIVSTSFPYFQDDIDGGGGGSSETLNHKSFDDTNYFPIDSGSGERRFEQNKNKNSKPYGHNVKPLNSKPINSGSFTTIQTPTVINSRFDLSGHRSNGGGGRQTTTTTPDDSIATTTQSVASSLAYDLLPPGNFKIKSQKSIDIDNDLQRAQSQSIFGGKTNDGHVGDKASTKQSTSVGGVVGGGSSRNSIIKQTSNEQQQQEKKYGPSTTGYFTNEEGASTTTVKSKIPDSSTISSLINGHYITKTFPFPTKIPSTNSGGQNVQNNFGGGRGTSKYNVQQPTTTTTAPSSARTDANTNWPTIGYTTLLDPYTINDGLMKGVRVTAGSTRNSNFDSNEEEGKTTENYFNSFTTPSYQTRSNGLPSKKTSFSFSSLGGSGSGIGVTGRNSVGSSSSSSAAIVQTTAQPNSIEIGNRFSSFGNTNKNINYDRFGKSILSSSSSSTGTTITPPSNNRFSGSASKSSSSSTSHFGKNTDDFENTYNNAMQQKANHIFGSLNDTSADHLMNVMKKADDNRNVRRLILLLIQTCDDDFNRTIEESRQALLNALIDMDITEGNDSDGEIRIIRTKSKTTQQLSLRRGKSIGGQQPIYNRIEKSNTNNNDDDDDSEDYIKSTSTELPITTYKRPLINALRQQTTTILSELQTTTTENSPTTTTTNDKPSDEEFHKIPFHIKVNSNEEFNIDIVEEQRFGESSKEIFDSTTTPTKPTTTINPFEFESISTTTGNTNSAETTTTTTSSNFDTTTHIINNEQQQQLNLENAIRNVPNRKPSSSSTSSTYRRVAKHLDDYLGQTANDKTQVSVQHKTSDARALELLKSLYSLAGRFGKR